jgi:hypothetical protein
VRLVSFSVQKYRSIIEAERLRLGQLTILIGPNNEGKSNILRALVLGMQFLSEVEERPLVRGGYRLYGDFVGEYQWPRDFPVSLQTSSPDGDSILDFTFDLDEAETADFAREVGSQLNGVLPIRLSIGAKRVLFQVRKQGPGARALTKKRDDIVRFIGSRIQLDYVPAVRTAEEAVTVVRTLVARELRAAEKAPEFQAALDQIRELQRPILDDVGATLCKTLNSFLPDVASVRLEVPPESRTTGLRDVRIIVDDGAATDLRSKGEGAQSLAALSLIQYAAQRAPHAQRILAVEEPEAHLHPDAIHELREVLEAIAVTQQVVLTTHSPILVNRLDIANNVIVRSSRAVAAKSVKEIREALGVRAPDNLASADVVLIVEGESDRVAIRALLVEASSSLASALADGRLAMDTLSGGSNLVYKLSQLRDSLCLPHAFLDHDESGRNAAARAAEEGLLRAADQTFAMAPGMQDSELEDLYEVRVYEDMLAERYNVSLQSARFRTNQKWSIRIRGVFQAAGQPFTDPVEREVKMRVADAVAAQPADALQPQKRSSFDALVPVLERKLSGATG